MKITRIVIPILFLILPILARTFWFYQGDYQRDSKVATPDYASLEMPFPSLSTTRPKNSPDTTSIQTKPKHRVLIDFSHGNNFDLSEIDSLTEELSLTGAQMELSSSSIPLGKILKNISSYVVLAPTNGFTPKEIQSISDFIDRGGRLLIITDPTRNYSMPGIGSDSLESPSLTSYLSSVEVANQIIETFGISFSDDYLYNILNNEGNFRNIILSDIQNNSITQGLSKIVFYSTHSLKTTQTILMKGDQSTLSSRTDQAENTIVAASAFNDNVLAIGDLTFMTSPYVQVNDNSLLVKNIARFLTTGVKRHDLLDHPFLFSRPVDLIIREEIKLNSDMLSEITALQSHFEGLNLEFDFSTETQSDHDLLVLDIYPPDENTTTYMEQFDLTFSYESDDESVLSEYDPGSNLETDEDGLNSETPQENSPSAQTPDPTKKSDLDPQSQSTPTPSGAVPPSTSDITSPTNSNKGATPLPGSISPDIAITPGKIISPTPGEENSGQDGNEENPNTVEIPGFGKLKTRDVGLLLFSTESERNTVIILAENADAIYTMLENLTTDLTNCIIEQGNVAICSMISEADSSTDDEEPLFDGEGNINQSEIDTLFQSPIE